MYTGIAIGILIGCFISTIVWYFVFENNRSKINKWLDAPEEYFSAVQAEVGALSVEARQKIQDVIYEIKRKRK